MNQRPFKQFLLLLVLLSSGEAGWAQTKKAPVSSANRSIRYTNPIAIEPIRDPQILFQNGRYYMTGTSQLDGSITTEGPGVKLFSSPNLTDWKVEKVLVKPGGWYMNRIWAPEIQLINGKFYLTLNALHDNPVSQAVCVAVSNRIDGEYKILTPDKPLCEGNDSHLFQDDDGKVYLFNSDNEGVAMQDKIVAREIKLEPLQIVGEKFSIIEPGTKDDWDGSTKENVAIEGPYVIKRKGTYYLFYSSWGRGYEVGYATASNIRGPWVKYKRNPIYGAQDQAACQRNGKPYTQSPNVPFTEVGHGNVFHMPNGQFWLACHGINKGSTPQLVIDPMTFDESGQIHMQLTITTQRVPMRIVRKK
ncbi:MAG: family 43 glycosylhydrolase [Bacteroidota bacterium]